MSEFPDLDAMSEVERILFVFDEAIRIETESAGSPPCVCIMGHESYNSWIAAIKLKFSGRLVAVEDVALLEECRYKNRESCTYRGIEVFCSHSIADGLVMGHKPPKSAKGESN